MRTRQKLIVVEALIGAERRQKIAVPVTCQGAVAFCLCTFADEQIVRRPHREEKAIATEFARVLAHERRHHGFGGVARQRIAARIERALLGETAEPGGDGSGIAGPGHVRA